MSIYRYGVEVEDGDTAEPDYDRFEEADREAQKVGGAVVEFEFEYTDSYIVRDYSGKEAV
jgi:hypothetical protein